MDEQPEKSYVLHFQAGANGRVGPADVFARQRDDGSVIISRRGNLLNETDLRKITKAFALKLKEPEEEFRAYLEREWNAAQTELLTAKQQAEAAPAPSADSAPPSPDDLLKQMPPAAVAAAKAMLHAPKLLNAVEKDVAELGVAGETELVKVIYLAGVSRLLSRPLSIIAQGPSSSGKSYVIEKVASLFPPEAALIATQMTPAALAHMRPGTLQHRFVVTGERSRKDDDEQMEATRALREMQSAGRLSKLMPVKQPGGAFETQLIEQEGPIAYVESTTLTRIFDEDANRSLLIQTDETDPQTQLILLTLAARYAGKSRCGPELLIEKHHALQRLLQPKNVVVPFAEAIATRLPYDRVQLRRAFPQLLNLIQASALLHQFQRQQARDGQLLATISEDYALARELMLKPFARLLGGCLPQPAQRFMVRLQRKWNTEESFTAAEVHRKDGQTGKSSIKGYLLELLDAGVVEIVQEGKGNKPHRYRLTGNLPEEGPKAALPTVEEINQSD